MSPTSESTVIKGLSEGKFIFGLTVIDDKGAKTYDDCIVIVDFPDPKPVYEFRDYNGKTVQCLDNGSWSLI